jgi:DNA-binding CsgD family transcriptional regulator
LRVQESERESLRARIRVAVDLAIGNSPIQAQAALANVAPNVDARDDEITALYFQACAIAAIKARRIAEGFAAFESALAAARRYGERALCARILINYGTAGVQDGDVALAISLLDESLAFSRAIERSTARNTVEKIRALASTKPVALTSLAEALFAAGQLERAAQTLREFYAMRSGNCGDLMVAAAVGIPASIALSDEALLRQSYDVSLLDLAFARHEQWLTGPLVEAFCARLEYLGRRDDHDALLRRALGELSSLDNSLSLGIRLARLGPGACLPRIAALMAHQCAGDSELLRAYQDLFDSFVAARRQLSSRSRDLALRAERAFARAGRPFVRALALQACKTRQGLRAQWTGAPVPRRLATQLTRREQEVAQLAAGGMTNRSIATALRLSERTVHHHCESIFGKLGIHSRWQLASALAPVPGL